MVEARATGLFTLNFFCLICSTFGARNLGRMFGDNHDSDQSISEEEDLGLSKSSNIYSFSLSDSEDNKERSIQVLSQLEILRKDAYEFGATTNATISSEKRQTGLCVEDEIELPVFNNEDDSIHCPSVATVLNSDEEMDRCQGLESICNSEEEIISEEEKLTPDTFGSAKADRRGNRWSEVNGEVEALVCLNENTASYLSVGSFSKLNKSSKGQRKVKPNLLFRFRSQEKAFPTVVAGSKNISMPVNDCSQTKELHACANREVQNSNTESLHAFNGIDAKKLEHNLLSLEGPYNDCSKHSVTELLECLQEKRSQPQGNSEMRYRLKGRKTKAVLNRSISSLGDGNIDGLPDVGLSHEDEDILPNPKSVLQQRTIGDQFHEALEAVSQKGMPDLIFHKESSNGLFERLQYMMVTEKGRDLNFLQRFGRDESSTDERMFLDVRIMSRSLQAKLNVCCCALIGEVENSQWLNYFQMRNQTAERNLNIIFSSRICSDVELEVGNLIRIYPPWKEVEINGNDKMIILSTYFSQI